MEKVAIVLAYIYCSMKKLLLFWRVHKSSVIGEVKFMRKVPKMCTGTR